MNRREWWVIKMFYEMTSGLIFLNLVWGENQTLTSAIQRPNLQLGFSVFPPQMRRCSNLSTCLRCLKPLSYRHQGYEAMVKRKEEIDNATMVLAQELSVITLPELGRKHRNWIVSNFSCTMISPSFFCLLIIVLIEFCTIFLYLLPEGLLYS